MARAAADVGRAAAERAARGRWSPPAWPARDPFGWWKARQPACDRLEAGARQFYSASAAPPLPPSAPLAAPPAPPPAWPPGPPPAWPPAPPATPHAPLPPPLLRDYISAALHAYFARPGPASPVGRAAGALPPLPSLAGRSAYEAGVAALYARLDCAWLTPSELFSPAYGQAVAAWALDHHARQGGGRPLAFVEVGAGRGTLAADVLAAVRETAPGLYADTTYTSLERSPSLAAVQEDRVVRQAGHACFRARVGDAATQAAWGSRDRGHAYVLAFEVLDNLAHDLVRWRQGGWWQARVGGWPRAGGTSGRNEVAVAAPATTAAPMAAAEVVRPPQLGDADEAAVPHELWEPAADPLILRVLQVEEGLTPTRAGRRSLVDVALAFVMGAVAAAPTAAYLPTTALALFDAAVAARPNHTLLAADFDALPSRDATRRAPVVAATRGGAARDYARPLDAPFGRADIFFPTDFDLAAALHAAAATAAGCEVPAPASAPTSAEFFRAHADLAATTTRSGWNPLLHDFVNTRVLVAECREKRVG